ncbi:putative RNA methyltransferase [Psychrobacter sp.]|uniref:putative RNA methyltransferase n=1 Tax=Psychrobacter sp. TaxID=56811 RepID=UPI0025F54DAC|nr:methyltransferase domain-containing protein [Psychrobacter sp.]
MPSSEQVNKQLPLLLCPYCQSPLLPDAKTWLCDGSLNAKGTRHPFDVARQGYVNLLPVQHKKSKEPGDSQQSIDARHRFLSQGFYLPLQQQIVQLIKCYLDDTTTSDSSIYQTWLDIGCGEGYYTQAMAKALQAPSILNTHILIAIDISKPAVVQLAKMAKNKQALWHQIENKRQNALSLLDNGVLISFMQAMPAIYPVIASAAHLPLADHSVDGICTIFSPILPEEFARVLKSGGRLLIAKPDTGHLQSMREALFDEVRPHDSDKFLDELAPYFELKNTHQVQCELSLNADSLADLLTMTPYSYRAKAEKREALLASTEQEEFKTEARFVVYELVAL